MKLAFSAPVFRQLNRPVTTLANNAPKCYLSSNLKISATAYSFSRSPAKFICTKTRSNAARMQVNDGSFADYSADTPSKKYDEEGNEGLLLVDGAGI